MPIKHDHYFYVNFKGAQVWLASGHALSSAERGKAEMSKLLKFIRDERGVGAVEYALIAGTTALVLVAVLPGLQSSLNNKYSALVGGMQP